MKYNFKIIILCFLLDMNLYANENLVESAINTTTNPNTILTPSLLPLATVSVSVEGGEREREREGMQKWILSSSE